MFLYLIENLPKFKKKIPKIPKISIDDFAGR